MRTGGGLRRIAPLTSIAVTGALLASTMLAATSAASAATAASTPTPGSAYVALGDSFASGPGIPDVADESCVRSTNNTAALVARQLKLSLTDVSCSGATTADVLSQRQHDRPPQVEAVTPDTKLVTVIIGNNDVAYTGATRVCAGDGAVGKDCLGTDVQPDQLDAKLAALPAKLDATLRAIKRRAPKATVVVLPYVRVLPAVATPCPPKVPMSTPTLFYLDGFSDKLHTVIKQAATKAKMMFVDSYRPTGHDACAPAGRRWVEGADASMAAQFHPSATGMKAQAEMVVAALAATRR